MPSHFLHNIQDLLPRYDGYIIDLWGIIHDGTALYPGVVETLNALKAAKKQVVFLSNAPRRAWRVIAMLEKLGVPRSTYVTALSSGEICFQWFQTGKMTTHFAATRPLIAPYEYLYIGPEKDRDLLDTLPYLLSAPSEKSAFALVTGYDHDNSTLEEKLPQLEAAARYQLPLICANPDQVIIRQNGTYALCAGHLASAYETMGGKVHYFGKPYKAVYEACMQHLSTCAPKRILAIGDSLETDIKGANSMGLDSVLVTGGLLSKALHSPYASPAMHTEIAEHSAHHAAYPTYVLPAFRK